jgi:hypothetical protein
LALVGSLRDIFGEKVQAPTAFSAALIECAAPRTLVSDSSLPASSQTTKSAAPQVLCRAAPHQWPFFRSEKNTRAGLISSVRRGFYFSLLKAGPLLLQARETDAWLSKNRRAALLINHDVRFDETGARPWEMNNPSSQCADIMGCYKKYTSQGP